VSCYETVHTPLLTSSGMQASLVNIIRYEQ